ncbi:SPRY_PRY_C-I_1 domain-containing protein isoform X2 [Tachysurus fulvidraco]|uniref:SPRY_PRY_C-I_1 domain-containing protein isoform X2 n=1 Tax=Tachysurus fulvidraco TaxID=1234273 RepID=UPI001FEE1B9E|nr:SPRY_PRY_C-I_1 domain-containing protein isoform X2 [Tachysurus fulvidraco]
MTLSETGEYNTGASHSLVNLGNPHKERENQRTCKSEPFLKPKMSLSRVIMQKVLTCIHKSKIQKSPKEEKTLVLKDSNKLGIITDNNKQNLPQKNQNKSECVRSQQESVNAGGLRIPRKVWENLTRPSAKVILDPNTANPTLKLSEDGRSVRTKTHKEFHSSQSIYEYHRKSAQQYNGWMCVQAKEGYSTGRHYWEVDLKGKCDWRVGVVKESAPRSGFINLNTATGYWTLRLQLGSLIALTEPITKLNQAPPAKLGVHLDVEKGQVSFYDAMRRKNIYTFNTEFRNCGKIYPVFGTVETDKPLKII